MKRAFKTLLLSFAAALLLAGCKGDEIDSVTEQTDPALSWSASSYTATIGADNDFPTLTNAYGVEVDYSSSDETVATISSDGLTVTLLSAGSTSIMAHSEGSDKYSASSASYALTVQKAEDGISWSVSELTISIADTASVSYPTLSNPGSQTIAYSSSNASVATIGSSSGKVTVLSEGEVTITATAEANEAYEASSASYTLTIEGTLSRPGFYWSADSYTATLASSENSFPTLNNPNSISISYSSSDESIATVSSSGSVTPVGAGTCAIIATSEADETYRAGTAQYTLKVVKQEVSLSWSESSFTALLEGGNDFPSLSVSPSTVSSSISYSSSNTSVATINSSSGALSLLSAGSTTISASFAGNDTYKSASAAYTLMVKSSTDTGAGSYTYASTGNSSSEDDISNTTFTRKITLTWSGSSVSVEGDYYGYVSTSGGDVTVNNSGDEYIVYELSGTSTNGSFKLYSSSKQALLLNGLTLTNPYGAAIDNQSGKRTFVMIEGSNTLSDGSSASYSATGDEDMKGVFFSEGQLILSGSGSLSVNALNAQSKSGIVSDDYVRVMNSPSITVSSGSSAGHGIKANNHVQLSAGSVSITTAAAMKKGINSEDYVLVEGGTHSIKVTGGVAYDSEDGEYTGSAGIKADNYFSMTDGSLTITNSGKGGKGVRAGSDSYTGTLGTSSISGGILTITTTGSESNDVSSKGIKIGYTKGSSSGWGRSSGTGYGDLNISGGSVTVNVTNSEGVECKGDMTISGGEVYVTSSADDAINSAGEMDITGGYVYAYASRNDALDANKDLKISGGYVLAICTAGNPEVAIDANTEESYKLYIYSGATVVAYGGLESGYSSNNTVYSMSATAGSWNALYNGSSYIAAFKLPSGISSVALTAPSLSSGYKGVSVSGTTYASGTWGLSGISGGTAVSLSSYSGGGGGHGGGGGGHGGGGGGHGGGGGGGWGW